MNLLTTLAHHVVRRPQRITLLQQVAAQGSITQAAKAAGLSYKAAWDAIDEMNNLAGQPLVERSVGGRAVAAPGFRPLASACCCSTNAWKPCRRNCSAPPNKTATCSYSAA